MNLRLRSRDIRHPFTGFTTPEVEKMEKLLKEAGENSIDIAFFKTLTTSFNCSSDRAGKPRVKWTEIQHWYQNHLDGPAQVKLMEGYNKLNPEACPLDRPEVTTRSYNTPSESSRNESISAESTPSESIPNQATRSETTPTSKDYVYVGRLRPRDRKVFSGFTIAEVEKMEKLLKEVGENSVDIAFYKKLTYSFNYSDGRAGKPPLKWTEVQNWFLNHLDAPAKRKLLEGYNKLNPEACPLDRPDETNPSCSTPTESTPSESIPAESTPTESNPNENSWKENTPTSKGEKARDVSKLEFEARCSKDGAWYDVERFLTCRDLESGETVALVRYAGFGSDEDEWVSVKECIRERSIGLDHSECHLLKVGNLVLCFQEKREVARYYDAHIIDIRRRMHDIRGCRCIFWIRYNHNNVEERVDLSRLCRRP